MCCLVRCQVSGVCLSVTTSLDKKAQAHARRSDLPDHPVSSSRSVRPAPAESKFICLCRRHSQEERCLGTVAPYVNVARRVFRNICLYCSARPARPSVLPARHDDTSRDSSRRSLATLLTKVGCNSGVTACNSCTTALRVSNQLLQRPPTTGTAPANLAVGVQCSTSLWSSESSWSHAARSARPPSSSRPAHCSRSAASSPLTCARE